MELEVAQLDGKIKDTPKRKASMIKAVDKVWCLDLRDDLRRLGFDADGSSGRADLANR